MKISKAIEDFLIHKVAEGLSQETVNGYQRDLKLWIFFQADIDVEKITSAHLLNFVDCSGQVDSFFLPFLCPLDRIGLNLLIVVNVLITGALAVTTTTG